MRWWEKQIGGTARGRIIALLRRGASTVEELAAMCDERGCEVKATGSAGKHVKKDYIKALKKADRAAE